MKIRLGYVANALRLENCSPSKTITVKHINNITNYGDRISRLTTISRNNLENTLRVLKANYYDHISVYRFTSRLVPLSTHPHFLKWDYVSALEDEFVEIGNFVKDHEMRVSLHPDHFTLLNSPKPEVKKASLRDLDYHVNVLEAMGLGPQTKLVIHVGGKYQDRKSAILRFKNEFKALPLRIKERLVLENDDRCFTAAEVLSICQELIIPMVLDVHHHQILNNGEKLTDLLPMIFNTWSNPIPKVHISSPRDRKNPRNHADYIETATVVDFLETAKKMKRDFDIMLEAKEKDLALFKLANDLKERGYNLPSTGEIVL